MGIIVRATEEDDWERVRGIRLEMLADTPLAYLETLDDAHAHDEGHWRERARRGQGTTQTLLAAIDQRSGSWVGSMGGYVAADSGRAWLVGVYVSPRWRGRGSGVADALLDGIEQWASAHDDTLRLEVHEENPRAIAFYERRGFVLTGHSVPYPLNPRQRELEMLKRLS